MGEAVGSGEVQILYKDKAEFERKRAALVAAGISQLQVIADFDRTLTSYYRPGTNKTEVNPACHGVVETYSKFPPEYRVENQKLFNKYYPLETDVHISHEQKYQYCTEWWTQAHELLLKQPFERHDLELMCKEADICFREHADTMIKLLNDHGVPFLVFSAGIADVLEEAMRQNGLLLPNTHVISNRLEFDASGRAVAFDSHLIHSLNKNEAAAIDDHPYWEEVAHRPYVLLMGDALTDLQMSEGVEHQKEQLAVGFLNVPKSEKQLQLYLDTFDVVITNDGPFDLVIDLLKDIIGKKN